MSIQSQHRVVILGGGYAGLIAAQRLTRQANASVTLINNRRTFVERIRLHQTAANNPPRAFTIDSLIDTRRVNFIEGHVAALDADGRTVTYTADGQSHTLPFDSLIYALGSSVDRSHITGDRVFTFSPTEALTLRDYLSALPAGGRVAVIGGGLTGIEGATEFAEAYPTLNITLMTGGIFGDQFSRAGKAYLIAVFNRLGINVIENTPVRRVDDAGIHTDQGVIHYDVTLWAGGFTVPALAREAGLAVNERGQIVVDPLLRSVLHPHIYAAGDAAYAIDAGVPIRMACATALPMGGHAADNINARINGGEETRFPFRYYFQCISLGRHDGLIQMVNPDDTPAERVITGRAAALFKEAVCRFSINVIRLERRFPGIYRVPDAPASLRQLARA